MVGRLAADHVAAPSCAVGGQGPETGVPELSAAIPDGMTPVSPPTKVVVFLFDHVGRMWLRERSSSGILTVPATGYVRSDEIPAEAAYRLVQSVAGRPVPLDEYDLDDDDGSVWFAGYTDDLDRAPNSFVVLTVEAITQRLGRRPQSFVADFDLHFDRARKILERRQSELARAVGRHPSASWSPRPQTAASVGPHTIDLRLLGLCQLRCEWCWGPEHVLPGSVITERWQEALVRFSERGTKQVIFSGGEPTLSRSLRGCISAAKAAEMLVTLSTNAIRLDEFLDVVAVIDDIGIPLDGSTPDVNDRMRKRSTQFDAWRRAVDGIVSVQRLWRAGETQALVTVRTVIARPNLHDVPLIPGALLHAGADLSNLRLKLYQVEPFGPHFGETDFANDWAVSTSEALAAANALRSAYPDANVELQLYEKTVGRYFLVDPDGLASGTDEDRAGNPVEVKYGNVVTNFDATLDRWHAHQVRIDSRSR